MKDKVLNFLKRHKKGLIILVVLAVVLFVVVPKVLQKKANKDPILKKTCAPDLKTWAHVFLFDGIIMPNLKC